VKEINEWNPALNQWCSGEYKQEGKNAGENQRNQSKYQPAGRNAACVVVAYR
jgi:hypothetical protein